MESTAASAPAQHPIRLVVNDDLQRNRLTVFFRLVLAIPHILWATLWGVITILAAVFSWFIALVMGRVPEGLRNFAALALRIETQTYAYLLVVTGRYPSFNVGVEA